MDLNSKNFYLFFDTETTGLPLNWNAPIQELDNWPRLVQIAWILFDDKGVEISDKNYIIKPQGFEIPKNVVNIHGISNEKAEKDGVDLSIVLNEFLVLINQSKFIVAHNIDYDYKVVAAELLRNNIQNCFIGKKLICTMKSSTNFCGIKGANGMNKWPKLSELHYKLFGTIFKEAHNAEIDIRITSKCFWEMKELNVL